MLDESTSNYKLFLPAIITILPPVIVVVLSRALAMSTPLADAGPLQWDESYISLFDQSADPSTVPNIDWDLDLGALEDNPLVTGLAYDGSPQVPQGISAGGTPEDKTPERGLEPIGKKVKRKGRPISTTNDSQSAADVREKVIFIASAPLILS